MIIQIYYKTWRVLAELAKLSSLLFFLNCGPRNTLVDEIFDMSSMDIRNVDLVKEKELTIINSSVDLVDVYMPPSTIGGSDSYIKCDPISRVEPILFTMNWFNILPLHTTKLGNICQISISLPAKIRESLNNAEIRNKIVLFQVEWDASFTTSNISRIITLGFLSNDTQSFDPVYQFRGNFDYKHSVLRMADLQRLNADTKFSIKSDIGFPLEQNNTELYPDNTFKVTNLRFILGY